MGLTGLLDITKIMGSSCLGGARDDFSEGGAQHVGIGCAPFSHETGGRDAG